ncbi:MAG: winged helix-turn-helix transcriptional regulator [Hyphomicrobiales bacterium]|nr:winged helix-turn-helix transcriptional regulator [Hyphomicrobiales bacterium]
MDKADGTETGADRKGRGRDGDRLDLENFFPYRLAILQLAVSKSISHLYSGRFGLSTYEWRAMAALGSHEPMSASQVCDNTNLDKVQVSRAINGLIAAGLVRRLTDRDDRRRSSLRLTAKGTKVYRQIVPLAQAREAYLLSVFSDEERGQLERLMDKLYARASELQRQG